MDSANFIRRIRAAGFVLGTEGCGLTVSPLSRLSDTQKAFIRNHKAEILTALKAQALDAGQAGTDHPAANDQGAVVLAEAWTPSGVEMTLEATSPEHAEQIRRWNPPPNPSAVTCQGCRHSSQTRHPALLACELGLSSGSATGHWWHDDRHLCCQFKSK